MASSPKQFNLSNTTREPDLHHHQLSCANCDIKFDSENSLRVHLQYHGESFLSQASSAPTGPWHSSTASLTSRSSTYTGLSPPPSSNNSNVDEQQQPLKPLHINNNSYPVSTGSTTSNHLVTNTPTPPSSAEAISPSSASSVATMISYEPLPSAIGPSHHLQHPQQSQHTQQQQHPQQQQQQQQQHQMHHHQHQMHLAQQQQQLHHMQQQYQQGDNSNLDYELDASSSAEEIWDLDSHTVKRYNNVSGDTSVSSSGHASMESPMGSYGGELHGGQQPHFAPTNAMWGPGNMYQSQQPQGFHEPIYGSSGSGDWLHSGSGVKRPGSSHSGSDEAKRIKTYQCEACDKWFTSSGHLKRHFNTTLHKNATRHQHKSGESPRTPTSISGGGGQSDLEAMANSIRSNLTTTTSTLNTSPSPSSPLAASASAASASNGQNNNVPTSPFYSSSRTSPAMSSPAKMLQPPNSVMRPMLPSMKDVHHHSGDLDKQQQQEWASMVATPMGHVRNYATPSTLYSPDSVSAVNRPPPTPAAYSSSAAEGVASDFAMTCAPAANDPYALQQQQQQQNFNYHGHYNVDYGHSTNGAANMNSYVMYAQRGGAGGYLGHHPGGGGGGQSDMSSYNNEGSVKDELDQLSVATGDLDEGLSETGTPATPTDSLEGPPTPSLGNGNSSGPGAGGEYRCNECNKVFNRLCYLKQHNKSFHNGEKPFKCGQCGKRFPVEVLYQEHLAKHAGDKPYKCEVCPKQFNHKTDLRRHMCLHTGEKPFACEVCGKGFIREDRMVKHSDTHKKKQPILMT